MKYIKKTKDYSKNRSDLTTYYNVGKLLVEEQDGEEKSVYGNKLTKEIGKGYLTTNLKYMRKFYLKKVSQWLTN